MASLARSIAQNTIIHLIGRVISIAMALVVVAIMTRALGPIGFGGYSTIIAFLQFFGIIVDFGLTLTANRMLGATINQEDTNRLMSNMMTLRFVSAVVFLGIAPCVALLFPYPTAVKEGMFLTTFSFLAIIMGQTLVPVFQKELRMMYPTIAELAGRVALLAGVGLAAYFHAGFLWFMIAIVIGSAVQYIFLSSFVKKFIRLTWAFDWNLWRKIIIVSWPIGLSILFNLVYLKADTIFLSVMRPQAEVGFYGASYRVIDQFTALATMFINLVLPPLTAAWITKDQTRFRTLFQGAFDAYAILALPLLAGALFLGPRLMELIASRAFTVSGTILGIHMIAMVFVFFSTLFGHVIVVIEKQRSMIWGYAINAAIGLLLYALLIPRYGMFGAAWATVATEIVITLLTYCVAYRTTKIVPHLSVLLKSVLAAGIMGIFLYALRGTNLAILMIGSMLIYGVALYALGGIKKETVREILSMRPLP